MEFCSLFHDHGCCSWRREWAEKTLNQILLEALMNCTKHFDLTSSLTASCVARFVICWVCRLYFSGLVCSVLSQDECLIKINYGRFCVALRKLFRPVWHRVWLICNGKGLFTRYGYCIITIWILGNPECLRSVADRFNITKSILFRVYRRICGAIANNLSGQYMNYQLVWNWAPQGKMINFGSFAQRNALDQWSNDKL